MKTYKTQQEADADIKDGVLEVKEDVTFKFSLKVEASLKVDGDINAWDINAWDINARDIKALDIKAWDINAWDINARDINARDIKALDINARDIKAWDISFYAVCFAYFSLKCKSITGRREKSKYFCLDREIKIKN